MSNSMKFRRDDGNQAFPSLIFDDDGKVQGQFIGMSLRQYYAAKALPACIQFTDKERWKFAAKRAFEIADAMLEFERNESCQDTSQ
jgi:hypothetical protein